MRHFFFLLLSCLFFVQRSYDLTRTHFKLFSCLFLWTLPWLCFGKRIPFFPSPRLPPPIRKARRVRTCCARFPNDLEGTSLLTSDGSWRAYKWRMARRRSLGDCYWSKDSAVLWLVTQTARIDIETQGDDSDSSSQPMSRSWFDFLFLMKRESMKD